MSCLLCRASISIFKQTLYLSRFLFGLRWRRYCHSLNDLRYSTSKHALTVNSSSYSSSGCSRVLRWHILCGHITTTYKELILCVKRIYCWRLHQGKIDMSSNWPWWWPRRNIMEWHTKRTLRNLCLLDRNSKTFWRLLKVVHTIISWWCNKSLLVLMNKPH